MSTSITSFPDVKQNKIWGTYQIYK